MSELLLNTIIEKLSMQSMDVDAIRDKTESLQENLNVLKDLQSQLKSVEKTIQKISFPEKEVKQLSFDLNRTTLILQQPLKNEVIHHHHVPKLVGITATMFLLLCIVCSGWYAAHDKLQNYIANDTKFRYLKLDTDHVLQKLLLMTDSLYIQNPKMRADVISMEELNNKRIELHLQADEKQKEADELKAKANEWKQ